MNESSKIWLLVSFIHVVGLALISTASQPNPSHKRLLVVTKHVVPQPLPQVVMHTSIKPTSITSTVKKEIPSPPKKPKVTPVKKQVPPVKKTPTSSKQVLKKIDQRLVKTHVPTPKPLPPTPLSAPHSQETFLPTYVDTACFIFRDLLVLPEKGLVKLTITVQPNGKIGRVEIETFESKKNLDYLMAMLPTLSLPVPEGGKDVTFTVLFCNDHGNTSP